ncbi:MAG TPA: invasion associated locus B family protein [Allosphingosinicella sp.]
MASVQQVGIFYGWAAFADGAPKRCYAAAEPEGRRGSGAAAFVAFWPEKGNRARPSIRLRADARPGSAILLTIGGNRFQLAASGREAVASNPAADAAIVAAMRRNKAMTVTARTLTGATIRDDYPLTGFPTALDAAALACAQKH